MEAPCDLGSCSEPVFKKSVADVYDGQEGGASDNRR